jgi:phage terminase small subunit
MADLTAKQKKFCDEYLISLNATDAAIKAGYSAKTADVIGCENLVKPKIKAYLQERTKKIEQRTDITMDAVLQFWHDLAFTPIEEMFDNGPDGTLVPKSMDEMTDRAKRCINEMKCQFDKDGNGWQTIKRLDQLKASEMIAKHLGGFIERKEVGLPGAFDKLEDDELDRRIAKEAGFFGSLAGEKKKAGKPLADKLH